MQRGNFSNNHQMVAKATSFLDDQNVPYDEEISSYNQHIEPTLHGPVPWTSNIQGSIPNPFEDNPQSQISSNMTPENAAWSEAPPALVREHDFYMPVANIVRIMRRALPPHAKVADEAKERVQECVSEFISFITSEANENCQLEHRKTITAEDIIGAMSKLGFDDYIQPLSLYLQKHRESDMYTSVPRRSVGNIGTEATATALLPKNTVLPPYTMVHPHFAMFNRGPYYDGSGTSSDPITTGQGPDTAATTTTINGTGPNLALGIGGGSSGNQNGGPYRSSQAGFSPYNPSGNYK